MADVEDSHQAVTCQAGTAAGKLFQPPALDVECLIDIDSVIFDLTVCKSRKKICVAGLLVVMLADDFLKILEGHISLAIKNHHPEFRSDLFAC